MLPNSRLSRLPRRETLLSLTTRMTVNTDPAASLASAGLNW